MPWNRSFRIMRKPARADTTPLHQCLVACTCPVLRLSKHGPLSPTLLFSPWASSTQLFPLTKSTSPANVSSNPNHPSPHPTSPPRHPNNQCTTILANLTPGLKSSWPSSKQQLPLAKEPGTHSFTVLHPPTSATTRRSWAFPPLPLWSLGSQAHGTKQPPDCSAAMGVSLKPHCPHQPHLHQIQRRLLTLGGSWAELDRTHSQHHVMPAPRYTSL